MIFPLIVKHCIAKYIFIAVAILQFFVINSTQLFAVEPILIDENLTKKSIGLQIEYLSISDKTATIDRIKTLEKQGKLKWKKSQKENLAFGFVRDVYWVRFTVKNISSSDIQWHLFEMNPRIDYLTLYEPKKSGYRISKTGSSLPYSERPIEYRYFIFPLKLKAKDSKTYYLRYETTKSLFVALSILSPGTFVRIEQKKTIFLWIFYGILIVMIIYNLFVFVSIRDLSYIFYAFHILFFMIMDMGIRGISFQYLWPNSLWWANFSVPVSAILFIVSLILFAKYFIKFKEISPALNKLANIIALFFSLSLLTLLFNNYKIIVKTTSAIGIMTILLFFIVTSYLVIKKKSREALFFLIAFTIFSCGGFLLLLVALGVLPVIFFTIHSIQIGLVIEVTLLSFALTDRINVLAKELKSINLKLENKVKSRTKELEFSNKELIGAKEKAEWAYFEKNKLFEELQEAMEELETINEIHVTSQMVAQRDMNMATHIQKSLFPKTPPQVDGWDIAFVFKPMSGVSGDLYDFFIKNNKLLGLTISDVSGHGIASSLITMIARSVIFRNIFKNNSDNLNVVMDRINDDMTDEIGNVDNYLTSIILRFMGDTVEYVNAGHTDLLCKKAITGEVEIVNQDDDIKGVYLGLKGIDLPSKMMSFQLLKNDILLLFTDCITESFNMDKEQYGEERLMSVLKNSPEGSSQEILDFILNDFYKFRGNEKLNDDLTVIVIKKK